MEICVRGTQKHRGFKNRAILSHETYIAQERPQVLTEEKTQGSQGFMKPLKAGRWNSIDSHRLSSISGKNHAMVKLQIRNQHRHWLPPFPQRWENLVPPRSESIEGASNPHLGSVAARF